MNEGKKEQHDEMPRTKKKEIIFSFRRFLTGYLFEGVHCAFIF